VNISKAVTFADPSAQLKAKVPFRGCSSLLSISVDAEHENYYSEDGVLFSKDKSTLLQFPCGRTGGYVIPEFVNTLDDDAFEGCKLENITIQLGLTSLGVRPFRGCSNLKKFAVIGYPHYSVTDDGLLIEEDNFGKKLVKYPNGKTDEQYNIPTDIVNVADYAFEDAINLKSVKLNSQSRLGEKVFTGCINLEEIKVDSGNTYYKSESGVLFTKPLYQGDSSATLVEFPLKKGGHYTIPKGINHIGERAFEGCKELESVLMPYGLSIKSKAFKDCVLLNNVTYLGPYAISTSDAFKVVRVWIPLLFHAVIYGITSVNIICWRNLNALILLLLNLLVLLVSLLVLLLNLMIPPQSIVVLPLSIMILLPYWTLHSADILSTRRSLLLSLL